MPLHMSRSDSLKTTSILVLLTSMQLVAQGPGAGWRMGVSGCRTAVDLARSKASDSLHLFVEVERNEYLPGELINFTVSFENAGGQTLEVFDPWQPAGLGVELAGEYPGQDPNGPKQAGFLRPYAFSAVRGFCEGNTIQIHPGEVLKRQFRSDYDNGQRRADQGWNLDGFAPLAAGDFRLAVRYRGRTVMAPFRVVIPELEQVVPVKLHRIAEIRDNPKGPLTRYEYFLHAYVLRLKDKRYLAVDARPRSPLRLASGERMPTSSIRGYVRIGELEPGESLSGLEVDDKDNVSAKIHSGAGEIRSIACEAAGR